ATCRSAGRALTPHSREMTPKTWAALLLWVGAASVIHAAGVSPTRVLLDRAVEITSPCGWRVDPISGRLRQHRGVDLRAAYGEPVFAPVFGMVSQAGDSGEGLGCAVTIRHDDGYRSTYGHLSSCSVRPGDRVEPGTIIGCVGSTGHSTGPHLHF